MGLDCKYIRTKEKDFEALDWFVRNYDKLRFVSLFKIKVLRISKFSELLRNYDKCGITYREMADAVGILNDIYEERGK